MKIEVGRNVELNDRLTHEYLITNGLGGYSFNDLWQSNTRKYHSLYTISLDPPVKRLHVITKFKETIKVDGETYRLDLGSDENKSYLKSVERKGFMEFVYSNDNFTVVKKIAFEKGTNNMVILYTVEASGAYELILEPYIHLRDHHDVMPMEMSEYFMESDGTGLAFGKGDNRFYIASDMKFKMNKRYSEDMVYPIETRRGYDDTERHIIPGSFSCDVCSEKNEFKLIISDHFVNLDPKEIMKNAYDEYIEKKESSGFENEAIADLAAFSDDFLVRRANIDNLTIIAGYPWFTDWGRDTMIALPGLTLVLGKFEEAKSIITAFLKNLKNGIIPNNFPDEGQEPMYNTADGTLWLFEAVEQYYKYSKDKDGLMEMMPYLEEIIDHHVKGTINNIHMDEDGLLIAGDAGTQLTWMDVKVDGWVPTPRHGKAVEINALWYNALRIMENLTEVLAVSIRYGDMANKVRKSFNKLFWYEEGNYLYDVINEDGYNKSIRPNQIFAVSLTYPVLDESKWKYVVDIVRDELHTSRGLRSLSPADEEYHGVYEGDLKTRDGAYHRGTVWMWLIGPYLNAHFRAYRDQAYVEGAIQLAMRHLTEGALGSMAEIFNGDAPHDYRGCPAQAWSVAEILRVYKMLCSKCQ